MTKKAFLPLILMVILVALLAERSTVAGGAEKVKPKRVKMDCGGYRQGMERAAKSAGISLKFTSGSWGTTPAALRVLPAGAELCGVTEDGAVLIMSPLFGKDLEAQYAPLFAKVGCQPLACQVTASSTTCTCKGNDARGRLQTDMEVESFVLIASGKPGK